jgi:hypothetical protein
MRRALKIGVPTACGIAGFLILEAHTSDAVAVVGGVLLGGALVAALVVIIVRLGPRSQPDRAREARAREEFERTGRWPSE